MQVFEHRTGRRSPTAVLIEIVSFLALITSTGSNPVAAAGDAPLWTRLELVENTTDGPAFDRCQIEAVLNTGGPTRWRVFFGEARPDSGSGWVAIRSQSGCAVAGPARATAAWTLRGSPYFMVDVLLGQVAVVGRQTRMDTGFSIQKLTGFSNGTPVYETTTEKRTLRIPEEGIAAVPILVANQKETDEFGFRELILKFRARGAQPPVEYGEIQLEIRHLADRGIPAAVGMVRYNPVLVNLQTPFFSFRNNSFPDSL